MSLDYFMDRRIDSESEVVLQLENKAAGAPFSIRCRGAFKCLVCHEYTTDEIICDPCRKAVRKVRIESRVTAVLTDDPVLLDVLHHLGKNPALLDVLTHLGNEAIARYFIDSISTAIEEH